MLMTTILKFFAQDTILDIAQLRHFMMKREKKTTIISLFPGSNCMVKYETSETTVQNLLAFFYIFLVPYS